MNHIHLISPLLLLELHKCTHQPGQQHQIVNPTHLLLKFLEVQHNKNGIKIHIFGNNEDLTRSSQSRSVDKGKGLDREKKNKSTTSKTTTSSRLSWKDNIQFDAKEKVLTIDDLGNEKVINGSILPQNSKFIYPADKGFDKRVLKHVAKYFKQYKHGSKRDYFKHKEKTNEDMYDIVETHGREPTHLEFFKEAHSKEGGGFVANTATEQFLLEIENEVFDEHVYEEESPKRPIGFGFNVDLSDVFGVNSVLRKRGYIFSDNNMELKHFKEELASQKAMFLLMLKAVRNGKITDDFLDATKVALCMVQEQSSGNDPSNESRHTGPSTSTSQVN
ncbi:hypothetical protein Cgig2_008500 [Carnegiea gigantea]|uniref:Uncharacterized protein n=1 Tax=Carnegiea gigantea TaxID=171969 RepID=A0A9Q1QF36_9CARY|nr:hypothetical protein Cgig2_008500 [Carnegiea gigantea]